jgi:hypothetical protein
MTIAWQESPPVVLKIKNNAKSFTRYIDTQRSLLVRKEFTAICTDTQNCFEGVRVGRAQNSRIIMSKAKTREWPNILLSILTTAANRFKNHREQR